MLCKKRAAVGCLAVSFSPGLRRTSEEPDEFEAAEEQTGDMATMTQEEREYLRWFYRTEDCKCCCCL